MQWWDEIRVKGNSQISDVDDQNDWMVGVCHGKTQRSGGMYQTVRREYLLGLIGRFQFQVREKDSRMWLDWIRGNTISTSSAKKESRTSENGLIICMNKLPITPWWNTCIGLNLKPAAVHFFVRIYHCATGMEILSFISPEVTSISTMEESFLTSTFDIIDLNCLICFIYRSAISVQPSNR